MNVTKICRPKSTVCRGLTRTSVNINNLILNNFDSLIDVRSELEFLDDHIPGAINLPVLHTSEWEEIGTIYKTDKFLGQKKGKFEYLTPLGASLVSQNIAKHLNSFFIEKEIDYHPLIYCRKGGMRSNSLSHVLSQIGWNSSVLEGGYKEYRRYVHEKIQELSPLIKFKVIAGYTGSGKTLLLKKLKHLGEQVLNLEELANHRGSVLGNEPNLRQPSQKYFESLLLKELLSFDLSKTVWIESESSRVGKILIPQTISKMILESPFCYEIVVPPQERVNYILKEYKHLQEETNRSVLKSKLDMLRPYCSNKEVDEWFHMIENANFKSFVLRVLTSYYDKLYLHSQERRVNRKVVLEASNLEPSELESLARTIITKEVKITVE